MRFSVLILTVLIMVLCILFPPRKWVNPKYASSTPRRGYIWHKESTAKMWVSPHLYIDLEVKKDFTQLFIELPLIAASGLFFFFLLGWLSQPDEKGMLFFSFIRNRYLLSMIFVLTVCLYDFLNGPQYFAVCYLWASIVLGPLVALCWFGKSLIVKVLSVTWIIVLQRILWIICMSFTNFAIQIRDTSKLFAMAIITGMQLLLALPLLLVLHLINKNFSENK